MTGPDDDFEDLRSTNAYSGPLGRFDPRSLIPVALVLMGVVFIVGLIILFFVARNAQNAIPPLPTQATGVTLSPRPATETPQSTATPVFDTSLPTPTLDIAATNQAATITNLPEIRLATLTDIKGIVRIRNESMPDWQVVEKDLSILPGTTVLTDEASSVKIAFSEGSVVRLSSQTQFTLVDLSGTNSNPFTTLSLDFGKVWAMVVSPLYGQFQIRLPVGTASVSGSFMSAEHNTTDQVEIVTCLEGHCRYDNANGAADLTANQQVESINSSPPSAPHPMDTNQLEDWAIQKIPEVSTLTPTATPSNTPTITLTPSLTFTPSLTYTPSLTFTPSPTVPTSTLTATLTPSSTITRTPTFTFTFTLTPTITSTATAGPAVKLGFVVQPPASIAAGAPFTVRVTVQDASGATVPYTNTTISLSIGSNPGGSSLSGSTSVGTVGGVAEFPNISLNKAGTGYTLVATAGGLSGATSNAFTVVSAPAASFTVSGLPGSVTAGTAASVTVTAKDAFGNPAIAYGGTVTFSSSDLSAALPANYSFTAGDAGTHTFNNVVLKTAGSQSVTAKDTGNGSITGTQSGITVTNSVADHFNVSVSPNPVRVGASAGLTITAKDAFNNTVVNYTGQVDVVLADDPAASDPANYTFTGSEGGTVNLPNWIVFQTPKTSDSGRTVNVLQVANPPFVFGSTTVVVCNASGSCP